MIKLSQACRWSVAAVVAPCHDPAVHAVHAVPTVPAAYRDASGVADTHGREDLLVGWGSPLSSGPGSCLPPAQGAGPGWNSSTFRSTPPATFGTDRRSRTAWPSRPNPPHAGG
jgi:hypothetical protein